MNTSHSLPLSQPSAGGGTAGTCSVCLRSEIKLTLGGVLHHHGPRSSHCQGVGRTPTSAYIGVTTLGVPSSTTSVTPLEGSVASADIATTSLLSLSQTPPQPPPLTTISPGTSIVRPSQSISTDAICALSMLFGRNTPTIKWIPRAARQQCATLLTKLFLAVTYHPDSILAWVNLLSFAKRVLYKQQRGGVHRNLSNILIRRCKDFNSIPVAQFIANLGSSKGSLSRRGKEGRKEGDVKELSQLQLANTVSAKLEEGNCKGAVRPVCSDDIHAPLSSATLQAPRHKHPTIPNDRKAARLPAPMLPTLIFDDSSVPSAL